MVIQIVVLGQFGQLDLSDSARSNVCSGYPYV